MKTKPTLLLFVTSIAGVTALLASTDKTTPQLNLNNSIDPEWETRLSLLEEKVSALEQENFLLKQSLAKIESTSNSPKHYWQKKEFNGETYYVSPAAGE